MRLRFGFSTSGWIVDKSVWDFLIKLAVVGRPSPLWMAPFLSPGIWNYRIVEHSS